jgi:indole-3-glycerol phosphate synthase
MAAEGILDRIVDSVRGRLDAEPPPKDLVERALDRADRRERSGVRSLDAALGGAGPAVIAECKRASPSAGLLRTDFDPVALAESYAASGAAAVSVVTEPDFFHGELGWVELVRGAIDLPVLRKDFVVDERQLFETAIAGADAVLLIQRILTPDRLRSLLRVAEELRLDVLLELFADEDPSPAVESGARIIGVNARDLGTFAVDLGRVSEIADMIPDDRIRVAESGITSREDLARLHRAGYDAFLVGEHLVRAEDPGAALEALLAPLVAG